MRFALVDEHRNSLPVNRLCNVTDVSPCGYRSWRNRPLSTSQRQYLVVLAHIREQFDLSLSSYGRPRMTEELKVDLSRFIAAPSARLGHFPFEGYGAFPAQC